MVTGLLLGSGGEEEVGRMGRVAVAVAMLSSDTVVVAVVAEMALVKSNQARSEIITSLNTSGCWLNLRCHYRVPEFA